MIRGRRLCGAEEVPEGGGRDFHFSAGDELRFVLVVRKHGVLRAYENSCPHLGTPLNFLPGRFFDRDGEHLLCATHGALFRIEDGLCISGPCLGRNLRPLAIHIENGAIILREAAS